MRRGSLTGFEVRILSTVMFFLVCGLVFLVMFRKKVLPVFYLGCGASEPLVEARRAEAGLISGSRDEALIVELCAEIEGVDVCRHLPWVSVFAEETPDEFIHSDRFGTSNLHCIV